MTFAIQTPVTGQYVCGFADDHLTGRGKASIPVWTHDRAQALPATLENQAKVTLAGIFSFVLAK